MNYFHISDQAPTITDWVQTVIYILTGAGLIANFWYQRRNLQEQNRLRFIEEERDRRAIMPCFEFIKEFDSENDMHNLIFTIKENPCKYLMISPLTENLKPYFTINTGLKKDEQVVITVPEQIIQEERRNNRSKPIFKIDFMDKETRPYVQNLYITGFLMYISDPIEYQYIKTIEDHKKKKRFWHFRKKNSKI